VFPFHTQHNALTLSSDTLAVSTNLFMAFTELLATKANVPERFGRVPTPTLLGA
jgi:hypothetical protein